MDKQKTSVYLPSEKYDKAKKEAQESGVSYSDWVSDAIASALADPDFRNPTKPTTEWEKILQKLKGAQQESIQQQDTIISEIIENQKRLEAKIDSMMKKFDVEPPTKDKSGRRIFDD